MTIPISLVRFQQMVIRLIHSCAL